MVSIACSNKETTSKIKVPIQSEKNLTYTESLVTLDEEKGSKHDENELDAKAIGRLEQIGYLQHINNNEAYTDKPKSEGNKFGFAAVFLSIIRRGLTKIHIFIHPAEMTAIKTV